ncbi:bacteriohemerythrin [candidate division KSB1 bacterium]
MESDYKFCCPSLREFLKYWESTNLDVGFGIKIEPPEDSFQPFQICPYCGKNLLKLSAKTVKQYDKDKKYTFKWNEKYSIGIPWIDNQHKNLLEQINKLVNAIVRDERCEEGGTIIKFLKNYTKAHFGTEENFMVKHQYPGYPQHRREHVKFILMINDFTDEYMQKGTTRDFVKKVAKNLWEWYKIHILGSDYEFGEFLKNKNFIYDEKSANEVMKDLLEGMDKE